MTLPSTICILPWISIEASPMGTARPCCLAREDIAGIDLRQHTLEDAYKSEYMQQMRQQMRAGGKPATCKLCWDEEAAGRDSKRLNSASRFKEFTETKTVEELYSIIDWENDTPDQLWFVDLKLGNICNLKCRICGSWSSSKWAAEELDYMPKGFNKKEHIAYKWLKQGKWPEESPDFWANLKMLLPKIKYFEFTGGEPWLIEEHWDLLRYAVETGNSDHIDIHYNTNATVDPLSPNKSALWAAFGRVDIAFSIDNVEERFEYERYGANWEEANKIIDSTHFARDVDHPNITTQLCFTVNIQNVYYIDELLAWADTKDFNSIYFNMLHSPDHMSIQRMTPAARELVLNKLKTTFWATDSYQQEISSIIQFIENGPGSDGLKFLDKMKQTDAYRKQNFMDTHPEIAKAMGYE
jgi:MoaA/NifB/PqqE/SkfB family radical SAM enzyme